MYVVDYGEVFTDFQLTPQFYTVPKSGVIWAITLRALARWAVLGPPARLEIRSAATRSRGLRFGRRRSRKFYDQSPRALKLLKYAMQAAQLAWTPP